MAEPIDRNASNGLSGISPSVAKIIDAMWNIAVYLKGSQ